MDRTVPALITLAVLIVALSLIAASWSRRKKRQADLDVVMPVPADLGIERARAEGLYLATTPTGDRLNRIAVGGLGFRARLSAIVADAGILLPFPGDTDDDVFIAASAISAVGTASWTIDRGIEPGGLTVVTWMLGDASVDSYFRFDEPAPFVSAVRALIDHTPTAEGTETQ